MLTENILMAIVSIHNEIAFNDSKEKNIKSLLIQFTFVSLIKQRV